MLSIAAGLVVRSTPFPNENLLSDREKEQTQVGRKECEGTEGGAGEKQVLATLRRTLAKGATLSVKNNPKRVLGRQRPSRQDCAG